MTDTIEVEVDGVVEGGPTGRTPAWGFPAAIALVSVLALVVIVRAVAPGLRSGPTPAGGPAPSPPEVSVTAPADARVVAAREALAAWGRFATTGDLSVVDGWVAPDGPQYRKFTEEARAGAAGDQTTHVVTVSDATVLSDDGHEAVVALMAHWTQASQSADDFTWDVVLRFDITGRWIVWTVRDRPPGGETQ
ncbi:MAG: hypothetical protein AB1679_18850 [Actinomycetota bacterium]